MSKQCQRFPPHYNLHRLNFYPRRYFFVRRNKVPCLQVIPLSKSGSMTEKRWLSGGLLTNLQAHQQPIPQHTVNTSLTTQRCLPSGFAITRANDVPSAFTVDLNGSKPFAKGVFLYFSRKSVPVCIALRLDVRGMRATREKDTMSSLLVYVSAVRLKYYLSCQCLQHIIRCLTSPITYNAQQHSIFLFHTPVQSLPN